MDDDEPRPQMARDVVFLFCEPAHAGVPLTGEKVAVVTFGFLDEVEAPIIISLRDCEKLAVNLLKVLAYYDHKKADEIVKTYYPETEDSAVGIDSGTVVDPADSENVDGGGKLSTASREIKGGDKGERAPFELPTLRIQRRRGKGFVESLNVMGAYRQIPTGKTVLLCVGDHGKSTYLLTNENNTILTHCPSHARFPGGKWKQFLQMPDGGTVCIGPWQWRKLDFRTIGRIVTGRVYSIPKGSA